MSRYYAQRIDCVPVSGQLGELDTIVGEDRVDPIRDRIKGSRNSQAVRWSALSTSCVTANLLVLSMPTKR